MDEEPLKVPLILGKDVDADFEHCAWNSQVELKYESPYRYKARFLRADGELLADAPTSLGGAEGPEAVTMLTASATYCMASSLVFCLRRVRVEPLSLRAKGSADLRTTPELFRRVKSMDIELFVEVEPKYQKRFERCLERFTRHCIITESVRGGFPTTVRVHHPWGVHEQVLD